jgi:uncharacterized membrane protein
MDCVKLRGSLVQVHVVIVNVFHLKCLAGVELDSIGCLCLGMVVGFGEWGSALLPHILQGIF